MLVKIAPAFILGLFFAEFLSYFPVCTILLFLLCLSFKLFSTKRQAIQTGLFVSFAMGILFPAVHSFLAGPDDLSRLINREQATVIAEVSHAPQHGPNRLVLQMKAISILENRKHVPIHGLFRLTLFPSKQIILYGDRLEMTISLRAPKQFRNPGVFQTADYLERKFSGVAFLSNDQTIKKIGEGGNRFLKDIYHFRDQIREKILSDMTSPAGPILLAMVLGETGYLTDPIRDAFTDSGTNHILSISGSHLAMVSFFIFGSARFLLLRLPIPMLLRLSLIKIPSQWAALMTAIAAIFYTLLSGAAVATVRSLIMILAYLFSIVLGRPAAIKQALSLAALLIVIADPQAIFDISFQLSFLAILFIILATKWWEALYPKPDATQGMVERFKQAAITMGVASCAATFATMPLTLYYFHQFSFVGIISNFIVIPLTGLLLLPLGWLSSLAAPFFPFFPLAALNFEIGLFYFKIVSFFAEVPYANLHFASPHLLMVVLFILILWVLLVRRVSLRIMVVVLVFFSALFVGWGSLRFLSKSLRVTFLDVGQGDSAFIEFPTGETMLVDAGSGMPFDVGKAAIVPFLWERKIKTIDYLVGTHPEMDHIGGFDSIIKKFNIKHILSNGIAPDVQFYQALMKTIRDKRIAQQVVNQKTMPIQIGDCRIIFLHPNVGVDPNEENRNDHSIVFRLSCLSQPDTAFLFTGDIEKQAIDIMLLDNDLTKSTILKVPHHGARGSLLSSLFLGDTFLKKVSPKIAIFSVGEKNRYGHPHSEVIAAYKKSGAKIYRTDHDGAITVTLHPKKGVSVRSFRESRMQKVRWGKAVFSEEIQNFKKGLGRF